MTHQVKDQQRGNALWHDNPNFPLEDWMYEVQNGDTQLGYAEWVEHQREIEEAEAG